MKLLKYGFVGLFLLASAFFIIHPTQNEVFGQGTNTTNTTDTERPTAEGLNPGFVPDTEDGAAPPPPPANAITVDKLPKETPVKDPDSDPLSISNRTEILSILPANSTKIIKFVDEDLKNTTGVGLAPKEVLDKLTSGSKDNKSNDNKSLLQLATPNEVKQIESIAVNTTGGGSEEDEPVTNVTSEKAQPGEQTNATSTNATAVTGEQPAQTREEKQTKGGEETNLTNATSGEEQKQTGGGGEETNLTNATSGEEQKQTGGGEEKQTKGGEETNLTNATSGEEQKQTGGGGETTTSAPNAKAAKTPEESLNTTNVTSLLNATDSKGGNDNPEDGG